MKRLLHVAALATTLIWHAPAAAQTVYACGRGTVRDVEAVNETVTREVVSTRRGNAGEVETVVGRTETEQRRSYIVGVQLRDRVYVSQSAGDPIGTLDPLRLAAGDPIDICVNGARMILERPDGTDYRAAVTSTRPAVLCEKHSITAPQGCATRVF